MSRFFSEKYAALKPYTPGEQPRDRRYLKLNTNESPFPPSEKALAWAAEHTRPLNLYSDPECRELTEKTAEVCGLSTAEVLMTNGSDEILNFALMCFCDSHTPAFFPDITYGFYPVMARLNGVDYNLKPVEIYAVYPLIVIISTIAGAFITALYMKTIKASDTSDIE